MKMNIHKERRKIEKQREKREKEKIDMHVKSLKKEIYKNIRKVFEMTSRHVDYVYENEKYIVINLAGIKLFAKTIKNLQSYSHGIRSLLKEEIVPKKPEEKIDLEEMITRIVREFEKKNNVLCEIRTSDKNSRYLVIDERMHIRIYREDERGKAMSVLTGII